MTKTKATKTVEPTQSAEELIQDMGQLADMAVRDNTGMGDGEAAHQGDVYIVKVKKYSDIFDIHETLGEWADPKLGPKTDNRQLVPGNTKGSRHVVEGSNLVVHAAVSNSSPLQGPTIIAKGEWTLTHPEHAHHKFGAGTYVSIFQRDFSERGIRAVRD